MSRRRLLTSLFLVVGILLMVVSYFFWTAPWGAVSVENSNPRLEWAPAIFVLGVVLAFSSALIYELLPDRERQ